MIDLTKVNWKRIGELIAIDSDELCGVMEEELEKQGLDPEGDDFDAIETEIEQRITAAFKK